MSFFDDASLVFLPSGQAGKDGKAYSMKPTNGDGDFTFSRGSNLTATRIDSNGLIAKGRENLFLNSDTPATQSITITNGGVYVLSFLGSGSVVASGGASFTLNGTGEFDRVENFFVSSSTSVTLTISGTITEPQLELGLAATEYIESGASTGLAGILEDSPRFDYSGGASCASLLLEPSRTNLVGQSEYYGSNLLVNATIDTNNATSPEGLQNATLLTEDTNSGNHAIREASNILIAADDSQYVISFYAKSNGRNIRFIDDGYSGSDTVVNFNITSGGTFNNGDKVIDSDAVAFGDGWYYCYAVIDKKAPTQAAFRFSLRLLGGASNDNDSYTGDGSRGVWLYGKQVEDSVTYPTSYIPNHSGGSVTREADVNTLLNQSGVIGQTAGTILFDAYFDEAEKVNFSISDSTSSNFISIETTSSNEVTAKVEQGGSTQATITTTTSFFAEGDRLKCAIAYDDRDMAFYINGTQVNTAAPNLIPTCDDVRFGNYDGSIKAKQRINRVVLFDTRISDNNLATLTS